MNRKRHHQLLIRLNDEELARVKQRIAASGMSQQAYLLRAILNKPIVNTDGVIQILPQLKGIGNNLNQLTRLAHTGYPVPAGEVAAMGKELEKLWQSLRQSIPRQS
jgi:hypothetical protein